jgi:hypothetical protein
MIEIPPVTPEISKSRIPDGQLWDPEDRSLSTAELAECTCPEFCERDHDND